MHDKTRSTTLQVVVAFGGRRDPCCMSELPAVCQTYLAYLCSREKSARTMTGGQVNLSAQFAVVALAREQREDATRSADGGGTASAGAEPVTTTTA